MEERINAMDKSSRQLAYRIGDKGQEVGRLQNALNQKGLSLKQDGDFGPKTESELKVFQKGAGLVVDGVSGEKTRKALGIEMYFGIDVSHWNGNIRWGNVDSDEVDFVWAKISQGVNYSDPRAKENLEGCRDNGIRVGGYHFPSPQIGGSGDPKREVLEFLKYYGGSIPLGDMIPVLDLEAGVKGDPDYNRQWALEWLKELEGETGIRALVYTAKWYVYGYLKNKVGDLKNYPLWVADYTKPQASGGRNGPDSTCGWNEWAVWQWSSKGTVRGLSSTGIRRCDVNWLPGGHGKLESLIVR